MNVELLRDIGIIRRWYLGENDQLLRMLTVKDDGSVEIPSWMKGDVPVGCVRIVEGTGQLALLPNDDGGYDEVILGSGIALSV